MGKIFDAQLRPEISRLLNSYATKYPIYRFKPEELEVLRVKVDVDTICVEQEGIRLKLKAISPDEKIEMIEQYFPVWTWL
ncbi:MAG: hypothetical protein PHU06_03900 [Gallionella sp.]|nr:hypothetical protein [Gallionella sp.]MDD4958590.1 hypothetical protein [Gallionella sp.]